MLRSGSTRRVLLPAGLLSGSSTRMDATSALFSYFASGTSTRRVAAVELATGEITDLGVASSASYQHIALTPSSYVWAQAPETLVRQDRATGVRTTSAAPGLASLSWLAAGDGAAAWTTSNGVTVLPASPGASPVQVPQRFGRLIARGDGFIGTRDGAPAHSGVFSVSVSGVFSKIISLPAAPERYSGLDLDHGRVVYAGSTRRGPQRATPSARVRTLTGGTTLTAGAESTLAADPAFVGVSGTRGALSTLDTGVPIDFVDGGTVTGSAPGSQAKVSGPYAVVDGRLPYRSSGRPVPLPAADGTPVAADVYGSRFVYLRTDGTVRLLDATKPLSATNPATLGTGACTTCGFGVGIAADTVAWRREGAPDVAYDLRTKAVRDLLVMPTAVGDQVVVSGSGWALDLGRADSTPVSLGPGNGQVPLVTVDDHQAAWTGPDGAITVARLPFGAAHRPRLLGVVARSAFSPNADRSADLWAPQFDLSKPVPVVTLTIRSGTRVVRTLTGTGALGSVRGLTWDGRNAAGAPAPDGTYTWTLTGDAADGDGPLAAIDGTGAATGSVVVDRVKETASISAPRSSALVRATGGIPLTWKRTSAASSSPAVFDVRMRSLWWNTDTDRPMYGEAAIWREGTTRTSATVPATSFYSADPIQLSVRVRDAAGNVGAWSAWTTSEHSTDDRALYRVRGPWGSTKTSTRSFLGTTSTSTTPSAVLHGSVIGSRVYVWATTCRTCGELRISVFTAGRDWNRDYVVDTRSTRTRKRVLMLNKPVPRGYQVVSISPVGTRGRPRVYVDAVGGGW